MANGSPAFGQYKPAPGGGYEPWSLQVVEISGDRISGITFFLDTARFFPMFGLPDHGSTPDPGARQDLREAGQREERPQVG